MTIFNELAHFSDIAVSEHYLPFKGLWISYDIWRDNEMEERGRGRERSWDCQQESLITKWQMEVWGIFQGQTDEIMDFIFSIFSQSAIPQWHMGSLLAICKRKNTKNSLLVFHFRIQYNCVYLLKKIISHFLFNPYSWCILNHYWSTLFAFKLYIWWQWLTIIKSWPTMPQYFNDGHYSSPSSTKYFCEVVSGVTSLRTTHLGSTFKLSVAQVQHVAHQKWISNVILWLIVMLLKKCVRRWQWTKDRMFRNKVGSQYLEFIAFLLPKPCAMLWGPKSDNRSKLFIFTRVMGILEPTTAVFTL